MPFLQMIPEKILKFELLYLKVQIICLFLLGVILLSEI
jgi:hypothetical protein